MGNRAMIIWTAKAYNQRHLYPRLMEEVHPSPSPLLFSFLSLPLPTFADSIVRPFPFLLSLPQSGLLTCKSSSKIWGSAVSCQSARLQLSMYYMCWEGKGNLLHHSWGISASGLWWWDVRGGRSSQNRHDRTLRTHSPEVLQGNYGWYCVYCIW